MFLSFVFFVYVVIVRYIALLRKIEICIANVLIIRLIFKCKATKSKSYKREREREREIYEFYIDALFSFEKHEKSIKKEYIIYNSSVFVWKIIFNINNY